MGSGLRLECTGVRVRAEGLRMRRRSVCDTIVARVARGCGVGFGVQVLGSGVQGGTNEGLGFRM